MTLLWNSKTKSRYPSRETFLLTPRLFFFRERFVVPNVPFLPDFVFEDLGLQITRTSLTGRVEFGLIVIFAIVISDKQYVAKTIVLASLCEATTRRPATRPFLDLARRKIF